MFHGISAASAFLLSNSNMKEAQKRLFPDWMDFDLLRSTEMISVRVMELMQLGVQHSKLKDRSQTVHWSN